MKTLTSFQFAHAMVVQHRGEESYTIEASRLFHLSEELSEEHVICLLGGGAFLDLENAYPSAVEVSPTKVTLKQLSQLEERLSRRLRFVQDDELEKRVLEKWAKL